jgi:AcrR family transcriptional regulator
MHSVKGEGASAGGVRERLLAAALEVLGQAGAKGFTQVAVAERAGVRQSHLTYYFPTRDELLEAVVTHGVDQLAESIREVVSDADGGFRLPLGRLSESVAEIGHMRLFLAMTVEADADRTVRRVMVQGTRRMEAALADALGGEHATDRARMLLAALWGAGMYAFLMRPTRDEDLRDAYVALLADVFDAGGAARRRRPRRSK